MSRQIVKDVVVLDRLLSSIRNRDGADRVEAIKTSFRKETMEAVSRELIVQILAQEKFWVRIKFLVLYPKYLLPYLTRIRATN